MNDKLKAVLGHGAIIALYFLIRLLTLGTHSAIWYELALLPIFTGLWAVFGSPKSKGFSLLVGVAAWLVVDITNSFFLMSMLQNAAPKQHQDSSLSLWIFLLPFLGRCFFIAVGFIPSILFQFFILAPRAKLRDMQVAKNADTSSSYWKNE